MGLYHGWDHDPDKHADFVRGAVDPDDFDKEVNYSKRIAKKPRPKKKKGCPENDFGPHVYVWEGRSALYDFWPEYEDDFYERRGFYRREYKVCCGCGKTNGSRYTEEMNKLISKHGWYKANYGDVG